MSKFVIGAAALFAVASFVACGKDPVAASKALHTSGDKYLAQHKTGEAIIEYRKAIVANPRDAQVRQALVKVYTDLGDLPNASAQSSRVADLLPNDVNAQIDAGRLLLGIGHFEDARGRAEKALRLNPKNIEAQILRANALAGIRDLDGALEQAELATATDPSSSAAYTNLGTLQFAKGDVAAAANAFARAVAANPKSVTARLALANFYWVTNHRDQAEKELKKTLELEPGNLLANRALGVFYLGAGRKAEAEAPLKIVAAIAPRPGGAIALADYYAATQRYDDAKRVLDQLAADPISAVQARLRLASLGLVAGNRAETERLIKEVLRLDPNQLDALIGKARLEMIEGKLDQAMASAKTAVAAHRDSPQAQFTAGIIQAARGQHDDASVAFKEALRLNPTFVPAEVELARIALATGKKEEAVQFAQDAVNNAPGYSEPYLLLARAQMNNRNLQGAERTLRTLETAIPESPVVQAELGRLYLAKGERARARATFETALKNDPTELRALQGLIAMDFQDAKPADALAHVERAERAADTNSELKVIAARVYVAMNDLGRAETALKRAIELNPNDLQAYTSMARLYVAQRRLPEATAEFERLAAREPKNPGPVTVVGVLLQLQHKTAEAKDRFEKALEIDPHAGVAANNLAWLYAEGNDKLDIALALAQTAKSQLPDRHEVDDTLGWVYYRKGLSSLAVASFERSVQSQPNNASYIGHLGLAHAQSGNKAKARESLEKALKMQPTFDGADEARRVLHSIAGNTST
jgi:tetratricopeptide (TPR) repeat protein